MLGGGGGSDVFIVLIINPQYLTNIKYSKIIHLYTKYALIFLIAYL